MDSYDVVRVWVENDTFHFLVENTVNDPSGERLRFCADEIEIFSDTLPESFARVLMGMCG